MSPLSIEDKIELLKNLLSDPDDWVSRQILELASEAESEELQKQPQKSKDFKVSDAD